MGILDQIMQQDCAAFFDPDLTPGVEPVTLILRDGTERPVNAIVDRFSATDMLIEVANSATLGYSADEAERFGQASVRLPIRAGGTEPTTLTLLIPKFEDIGRPWHDAGACTFRLGQRKQK